MHTIHHTDAVILKSVHSGEANMRLWLFTKEFGLVMAMVQGVRKTEAKLKGHISEYVFVRADLVRGREVWRLVSVAEQWNPLSGNTRAPLARAYVRTLSMLTRFLVDEGVHDELFVHVEDIARILKEGTLDATVVDAWSLWKILALLGYIAPTLETFELLTLPVEIAVSRIDERLRGQLIEASNAAITESHL